MSFVVQFPEFIRVQNYYTTRVAVAAPVTIADDDEILVVELAIPGPVTIDLLATAVAGKQVTIKDGTGDAAINNIQVNATGVQDIDGVAGVVLNNNYQSVTFVYRGSNHWSVIE
jgi:hypothetical protein